MWDFLDKFYNKASVIYGLRVNGSPTYVYVGKTVCNLWHAKTKKVNKELYYKLQAERRFIKHRKESFSNTHFNKDLQKVILNNNISVDVLEIVHANWFTSLKDYEYRVAQREEHHMLANRSSKLTNKVLPTKKFVLISSLPKNKNNKESKK